MKTRTEKILAILKVLALITAIGLSFLCGSQLLSLAASFFNPDWAKQVYTTDENLLVLRENNFQYYIYAMSFIIAGSAILAYIWFKVFDLLQSLKMTNPFSMDIAEKIEKIAYSFLSVWIIGYIGKSYLHWVSKKSGISLESLGIRDEYLFIAGIIYILSQIFKRGIEIQEENQLTV